MWNKQPAGDSRQPTPNTSCRKAREAYLIHRIIKFIGQYFNRDKSHSEAKLHQTPNCFSYSSSLEACL